MSFFSVFVFVLVFFIAYYAVMIFLDIYFAKIDDDTAAPSSEDDVDVSDMANNFHPIDAEGMVLYDTDDIEKKPHSSGNIRPEGGMPSHSFVSMVENITGNEASSILEGIVYDCNEIHT